MDKKENLGPAETVIQSLLAHADHLYHGRPGVVHQDRRHTIGVRWEPVTHKVRDDGMKVVYRIVKAGKKTQRTEIGVMNGDGSIRNGRTEVGTYRPAGIFPEVAVWLYRQIATVWQMDNEFAARWASYAWRQEHRDLKVVLAAFMLVQSRKGDPVLEGGEVIFQDDDFRDVGEAMILLQEKGKDLNAKQLLRVWEVLTLPEIAKINYELGFAKSDKKPFLGRWPRVVEKWLRYREENPRMLEGLAKAGFRTTVISLAQRIGYKPLSDKFFDILRWKQKQAGDGRRVFAIGKKLKAAESWADFDEKAICEIIEKTKPNWKRIVALVPPQIGITRAIVAAAIEAGSVSNKDLIILTPTLEDLGLLKVQQIRERHEAALASANDMRAANIARNVRSKETKEKLEAAADKAAQKAVAEVMRDMQVYLMVDKSASMQGALQAAKPLAAKLIQAFPMEKVHVSVFNTSGREITIKHASTKGVENAFSGLTAGGGTDYGSGVRALQKHKPSAEEDSIFIFIGDEAARNFDDVVRASRLNPVAFGFLRVVAPGWDGGTAVRDTAEKLGIPCFMIDETTFDDPYAIPRTIRNLIAATPVGAGNYTRARPRVTLVDQILQTDLLAKPAWA